MICQKMPILIKATRKQTSGDSKNMFNPSLDKCEVSEDLMNPPKRFPWGPLKHKYWSALSIS